MAKAISSWPATARAFTMEGDPCITGDLHGKVKRHGVWAQQVLPIPIHMIFDETYRKSGHIGKATADWDVSHGNLYDWSDDNLREVEKGGSRRPTHCVSCAALINIPLNRSVATVERFNRFAEQGSGRRLGRAGRHNGALRKRHPLRHGTLTPAFVNTQGGPRRNKDAQIIGIGGRTDRAALLGGRAWLHLFFLYQGGGNIGECFAFGRIAGRNAARELTLRRCFGWCHRFA
jgi:hypothetical protein